MRAVVPIALCLLASCASERTLAPELPDIETVETITGPAAATLYGTHPCAAIVIKTNSSRTIGEEPRVVGHATAAGAVKGASGRWQQPSY